MMTSIIDRERLNDLSGLSEEAARERVKALFAELGPDGFWERASSATVAKVAVVLNFAASVGHRPSRRVPGPTVLGCVEFLRDLWVANRAPDELLEVMRPHLRQDASPENDPAWNAARRLTYLLNGSVRRMAWTIVERLGELQARLGRLN